MNVCTIRIMSTTPPAGLQFRTRCPSVGQHADAPEEICSSTYRASNPRSNSKSLWTSPLVSVRILPVLTYRCLSFYSWLNSLTQGIGLTFPKATRSALVFPPNTMLNASPGVVFLNRCPRDCILSEIVRPNFCWYMYQVIYVYLVFFVQDPVIE